MHLSTNRKILAAGAAILAVSFVVSLTPWYRSYCANDDRWTCAKVRKTLEWDYANAMDAGETGSIGLLTKALEARYDTDEFTVIPASSVTPAEAESPEGTILTGLCRDGGSYHVTVRDDGHIAVTCDAEGHDVDYTEYLDSERRQELE